MMAEATLPQKREGEEGLVSPKTKAQKKEEAILKAREWARKRKGGGDAVSNDNNNNNGGVSPPVAKKAAKSEESEDVITNLPHIPAKKSRRSGVRSDDISDTESIGSRTRSRRRSMGATKPAAAAAAATSTDAVKSPPKATRGRGRPRRTPKKVEVAAEEQVVEEKPIEQTPVVEEEKKEAAVPAVDSQAAEESKVEEEEAVEEEANEDPKTSFLPHFTVFLHSIIIQWSIAFAAIMTFCLDWWLFQFGSSSEEVLSSQRASSAMIGMWLITIAGYSIVFGTFSQKGWILTTSSLAVLSLAVKMYDEDMVSLPVYQVFGLGITIPDLLLCISFVACLLVMNQPPPETEAPTAEPDDIIPSEPDAAPASEEPPSTTEANADESKEVMEAVMIAAKEATGPRSLIGQRVSVEDDGFPSFGTVAGYDEELRLWTILFDDENQEEGLLNRVQLGSAFKSYSKHLADSLKAMWKSGEI